MVGRIVEQEQEQERELTSDDSFSYIVSVRTAFRPEPAKYDQFFKLLNDFSAKRITFASLIESMEQLFKDHPDLLSGFNVFLPKAKITSQPQASITIPEQRAGPSIYKRKRIESEGANFLDKLKKRFRALDTHVVESFRDIMILFKEGKKSENQVHKEVFDLLYYHEDLIDDFNKFLTDN